MKKIFWTLVFVSSTIAVHANNLINIPTITEYVAPDEKENLTKFENSLHSTYLIQGKNNNYHNILEQMQFFNVPGVSLAAIHNGKIIWIKSYGVKNSLTKEALTPETMFEFGSISKPFTALGALKLATSGKLNIDNNIDMYLTDWHIPANPYTPNNPVTARRLMAHIAGTNVHGFPGLDQSVKPLPSIVDVLNGKKPFIATESINVVQKPGSTFSYSGGGYSILQLAIQDITHTNFAIWMNDNVVKPLGMDHSTYEQPLPKQYQTLASSAHDFSGKVYSGNYHNYPEDAAAGLWSTPSDIAKALILLINAYYGESQIPGINSKYSKELFTPQKPSQFGLGLLIDRQQQMLSFGHDGGDDGFMSNMVAYVNNTPVNQSHKLKDGLIITTNSDNGGLIIDQLYNSFLKTMKLENNKIKTFKLIHSSSNLNKYATKFIFPGSNNIAGGQIFLDSHNQLFLTFTVNNKNVRTKQLYQIAKNEFISEFGDRLVYSWTNNKLNLKIQYLDGPLINLVIKK